MTKMLRMTWLATAVAAAALSATPAAAQVASSNGDASARARILRPLTLTHVQDFDLGDVLLSGAAPFSATVSLAQNGTLTCDPNVTCSGTTSVAVYNVTGTNNAVVLISAPDVTLTNPAGNTLNLAVDAPTSITLTNSGAPGRDFNIGGAITVADTTADGVYTGMFNVTVQYQ